MDRANRWTGAALLLYSPGLEREPMWNQNFMFKQDGATPLDQTENELFQAIQPTLDSIGLKGERYISVWVQGDEEQGKPILYTNVYARTAILDSERQAGMLQPYQGRSHQIRSLSIRAKGMDQGLVDQDVAGGMGSR